MDNVGSGVASGVESGLLGITVDMVGSGFDSGKVGFGVNTPGWRSNGMGGLNI